MDYSTSTRRWAADGVDEILRVHLDVEPLPDWATYEPDGATAIIDIERRPRVVDD